MSDKRKAESGNSQKGDYFVHQSSYVDDGAEVGSGSSIWHFCHIMKGARIGIGCIFGQNVFIGPGVVVGDRCKIQNNVSLYESVELADDVFCGPSCVFTNVYNPRAFIERKHEFRPTMVCRGATIGANATVICGVKIGRYALVGAGAVVKKDVADFAVVVGVPARQIGWVCKCGVKLGEVTADNIIKCSQCGSEYVLKNESLEMAG